jgi:uncharacterized protein (TIGR03067 family)
MRPRLVLAFLVLLGVTAFAPAPMPRRGQSKEDSLSVKGVTGDWKVISLWRYGPNGSIAYRIDAWKLIRIQDGKWMFCTLDNGVKPSTTYVLRIDGSKRPATIDFLRGNEAKPWMMGIVRFRGDKLEVLYKPNATERPTSFDNPPADFYLFTLTK